MDTGEEILREQIARWQAEGKTAEKMRKRRSHLLILLGASILSKMRIGEVDQELILSDLPEGKQQEVREWLIAKGD